MKSHMVRKVLIMGILFAFLFACSQADSEEPVTIYSHKDLSSMLETHGVPKDRYLYHISKLGLSGKIYVETEDSDGSSVAFILQGKTVLKKMKTPGLVSIMNESEEFVAWYDNIHTIQFKSGEMISIDSYSRIAFDDTGAWFLISKKGKTFLLATKAPSGQPVLTIQDFIGASVFVRGGRFYIFGTRAEQGKQPLICTVYSTSENHSLEKQMQIDGMLCAYDMDSEGKNVLCRDCSDLFSFIYRVNLTTSKRVAIGRDNGPAFFVNTGQTH